MTSEQIHERRWWTLVVLCLSLVMVIIGNTVLNVALPTLIRELDATQTELQWMVDSYALVFAGLLLTAGALGDRFGRKGALTIGLVIFGAGSLVSSFADSPGQLIATRAVMGLAAALVMPATLSILTNVFPPEERSKAIAIWAGLAGGGAAIGPIAGGYLLDHFWWGSVFLVNIPVVVAALVGGFLFVPKSRDDASPPLDPVGAILSIGALSALLYGIIEGPNHGWSAPITLGAITVGLVIGAVFCAWEAHTEHPMLDLRFFRNPRFSAASAAITFVFFAMFGSFFLTTQYLQLVLGYTPFGAGVRMLPMALVMMVAAPSSAKFVNRFGSKRTVTSGLLLVATGLAILTQAQVDSPYAFIILAFGVTSFGMGLTMAPSTTSIMSSLPLGKAGVGSAVNDTTRELGGALGIAVLGSIAASRYAAGIGDAVTGMPSQVAAAARSSLGAAVDAAGRLPGGAGDSLAVAAKQAFVDAMSVTFTVSAVVVLGAAGLVARFLPSGEPVHPGMARSRPAPADDEPPATDHAGDAPVLEPAGG